MTAAILGDDDLPTTNDAPAAAAPAQDAPADEWDEEEAVPGQLAVDVYETKDRLVVKARTAGVNKVTLM